MLIYQVHILYDIFIYISYQVHITSYHIISYQVHIHIYTGTYQVHILQPLNQLGLSRLLSSLTFPPANYYFYKFYFYFLFFNT